MKKIPVLILTLLLCSGCAYVGTPAQGGAATGVSGKDVSGNDVSGNDAFEKNVTDKPAAGSPEDISHAADQAEKPEVKKSQPDKTDSEPATPDAIPFRSWIKGTWDSGSGITLIIDETTATIRGYQGYGDIVLTGTLSVDESTQTGSFTGSATGVGGISASFVEADMKMKKVSDTEMEGTAVVAGGMNVGFFHYRTDEETVTFHVKKSGDT